jgi:predicted phosphoadenosine phosphosulfate sulfurtransferase
VRRVSRDPRIRFKWLCVPIKHRNACSRVEPYWYPWLEEDRHRWVRELPPEAIREVPGFYKGASVPDIAHRVYGPEHGLIADVRGIRADESLRRYRSVANKLKDNWIGAPRDGYSSPVSPIYDWSSFDVWSAPRMFGWDYNRTYDLMSLAGMQINDQRVCPPYGEEPLKGLWIYAQCWPDLWHAMIGRVHGAATAGRYAKTELYGFGQLSCPPGLSWREWCYRLLDLYPPGLREQVAGGVSDMLAVHRSKTSRPMPDSETDPTSGLSWRYLAMLANRGDLKQRRKGDATKHASTKRASLGLTLEDAEEMNDGTRY